jgi:NAD(P)-dependent dehydrogenase (short-subunit alcohol dehydrogenase family)
MPGLLAEKTAVVTGAASGNGRGIATRFAEEGADVVVADIQADDRMGGDPTHEVIEETTNAQAKYSECDITNPGDLEATIDATEKFGGIDIMVNNAGVAGPGKPVTEIERAEYDEIMEINLAGTFFASQKAAQAMLARDTDGSIINISSSAGFRGGANGSLYSMSKAGVRILTQNLAAELAPHNIRVNAIHPGTIETAFTKKDTDIIDERGEEMKKMTPMGRFGTPEEVGNAAVFLASHLASYTTAHSLTVDGGLMETF